MICSNSEPKDYTVLAQLASLVMGLFDEILFHLSSYGSDFIPFDTVDDLFPYTQAMIIEKHQSS